MRDLPGGQRHILRDGVLHIQDRCACQAAQQFSLGHGVRYRSVQRHAGWQYAGVYADEAKTGTKDTRANFQRLLADCRDGKIDLVITKSISRFARNTVTLLTTVRELKEMGVDVYFEEQNIHTMSGDGELMLTILASYAQEESLSVSENQKWRVRRNFENGLPWNCTLLGYRYRNGRFEVMPEEAGTVKRIFGEYLSGSGTERIVKGLILDGVPTRRNAVWSKWAVTCILKNRIYTGNMLLQQTFNEDHISKRKVMNTGQLPQYLVRNSHEAIIDRETFNAVQAEMARRAERASGKRPAGRYPFTAMLVCGNCGKHYRRKVTKSQPVWICTTFNSFGKAFCASKQIPESALMKAAASALGMDTFDADAFQSKITAVRVESSNRLVFVFKDGSEAVERWTDRSRADSWTDEMKQAARRKETERRRTHGNG